jgi:hypothetical protein
MGEAGIDAGLVLKTTWVFIEFAFILAENLCREFQKWRST